LPELLTFQQVNTYYGDLHVLKDVDYRIEAGEIVCLLGGNASGKSTTMKAIMGVVVPARGDVVYEGRSLKGVSVAERVRRGIAPVLEARRLFPRMTVYENLEMGAYTRPRSAEFEEDLQRVFSLSHASRSASNSSPALSRAASSRWWRSAGP
jgi:branched-chain amino acid transport system ATP-binding protein